MTNALITVLLVSFAATATADDATPDTFRADVAPLLAERCLRCHSGDEPKGDINLSSAATVVQGRGDGWLVVPGKPDESWLLDVVSGDKPAMPKTGDRLTKDEIAKLRAWIAAGAPWPADVVLKIDPLDWWSLRPLQRPPLPELSSEDQARVRTPVDAFLLAKLREQHLAPSPAADRRTLIRRLCFDLTGLPPAPEDVERFVNDPDPRAYEQLVDRLLDSPRYGERWARHWLDIVHYGDTHGYDKDKVRPHAWPYRDYVIRSLNDDKPYHQFVKEQLAGDHFYPDTADGTLGLGFIAAGPFDFVGQIEVGNGTMEKQRVRNIDRDDMVSVTMNTFVSLTAQCARCHDHKFDPISQEDYYSLQAVFAAVDRADRPYDADPQLAQRRRALHQKHSELAAKQTAIDQQIRDLTGDELTAIDSRLAELSKAAPSLRPEYGYHSAIVPGPDHAKWVQVDLGRAVPISEVVLIGAHDDFAGIGAGFGFPVRYKIEVSDDPEFREKVTLIDDRTAADVPNPRTAPQSVSLEPQTARYIRLTATQLAERQNDYILAIAELRVLTPDGENAAAGATVTALDSIEAPVRWGKANLVDGIYPGSSNPDVAAEIARLREERNDLLERTVDEPTRRAQAEIARALAETEAALKALPPQPLVYAAATNFAAQGNFIPTGGEPRPIFVLARGSEQTPLHEVGPGTVGCIPELPARFPLIAGHDESERRAALAEWIVARQNPLTWRSIVNRVWHYHFGRGLVETPNDFGRMGEKPTHPELLDWLAVEFRDNGQSLKQLHRLIVNSSAYRQSSLDDPARAKLDAGNRFLWRMNRQRLDAEAIRDSVLAIAGKLRHEMGGSGFRPFGFKDDHSPHYLYDEHDPDDSATHRRSIYRFIVRSVPDPFMTTLDCADPSLSVARRNETLTPLQALALLNNKFIVRMAEHFAERVARAADDPAGQLTTAYQLALGREPSRDELDVLVPLARKHGMPNVCRLILNMNEFVFVD